MLTQEQVLAEVKTGTRNRGGCELLDGRDYSRLSEFFPVADWGTFGFALREGAEPPVPRPWTEEEVLKQLEADVRFGHEKAEGERGISAGLMYAVVKMWMWVLEDPLQDTEEYAPYGMPLFLAIADKYGIEF